jgi:hypothetical protein
MCPRICSFLLVYQVCWHKNLNDLCTSVVSLVMSLFNYEFMHLNLLAFFQSS